MICPHIVNVYEISIPPLNIVYIQRVAANEYSVSSRYLHKNQISVYPPISISSTVIFASGGVAGTKLI